MESTNEKQTRLDNLYLDIAERFAEESKARRLKVGAVLMKNSNMISMGWNGMPTGEDNNCEIENEDGSLTTRIEVLHAESNCLMKLAAAGGTGAEGATLYTTYSPCPECAKLIKQAKIARVVYRNNYRRPEGVELLTKWGVQCDQLPSPQRNPAEILRELTTPMTDEQVESMLTSYYGGSREHATDEVPVIVADEPIHTTNLAVEPPVLTEQINAAGEPILRNMRPGRILLKYQGIKYGENFGFGVAGDEVFILNQETVYSKGDGYWGSWEQGTYFEAEVTTSHLCVRIYRKLTETQHFPRHDWKSDGLGGGHNGEYYYTCARCGEHDWIAAYGTVTDLRDGPCIVKERPEGQRGPYMVGEEGLLLNPDGSTGASGFG